jgi:hypothetical protein
MRILQLAEMTIAGEKNLLAHVEGIFGPSRQIHQETVNLPLPTPYEHIECFRLPAHRVSYQRGVRTIRNL